jgi:hypothetical protein
MLWILHIYSTGKRKNRKGGKRKKNKQRKLNAHGVAYYI